jgi:hypothetical protein
MNRTTKALAGALLLAVLPIAANAESQFVTGTGGLTANAKLDFRITIPDVLFLQVGTGSAFANNTTVDLIDFTVPGANVGDGSAIAASAASGDLGNGTVTAKVVGNNGAITLSSTTLGALNDGAGDTISFNQIATNVATLNSATALPHPALADGATTSLNLTPNVNSKVTNLDAKWTFSYLNQNVVAAGTYGGVNTQNGRVTYTAAMP